MSVIQSAKAWRAEGLSMAQKIVLVKLADNANDTGHCFPSIPRIAKECCCSRSTVIRAIGELSGMGFLKVSKRIGTSSDYTLTIPDQCHRDTGIRETPVSERHPPRIRETPPPVSERHPPSVTVTPKPSVNRQSNRKENRNKKAASAERLKEPFFPDGENPEFAEIMAEWFAYKAERKETYGGIGWRSCLAIHRKIPVADLREFVARTMANGWKSIVVPDGYKPSALAQSSRNPTRAELIDRSRAICHPDARELFEDALDRGKIFDFADALHYVQPGPYREEAISALEGKADLAEVAARIAAIELPSIEDGEAALANVRNLRFDTP